MARVHSKTQATAIQELEAHACAVLDISTLETQNRDSLDFHDLAVWDIRNLIKSAYERGVKDAGEH